MLYRHGVCEERRPTPFSLELRRLLNQSPIPRSRVRFLRRVDRERGSVTVVLIIASSLELGERTSPQNSQYGIFFFRRHPSLTVVFPVAAQSFVFKQENKCQNIRIDRSRVVEC